MPKFKLGDKVTARAFTDCFGQFVPQSEVLIVQSVGEFGLLVPHIRVKAVNPSNPFRYIEAHENHFELVAG